jgi:hypothetical protein
MLKTNNEYKIDQHDYKLRTMEKYQTEAIRNSDKRKETGLD